MTVLDLKIDGWKNRLLDLSKRNRLISYRDTKRSSLRILRPGLALLWDELVVRGRTINFRMNEKEDGESPGIQGIADNYIETNQPVVEQNKTLRNLRSKARTMIEERGVNSLYLAFGFVQWKENDTADQFLRSPIILVPVSLSLANISSPFTLSLHEDEIVLNPTLAYKFEHDFGLVFPDYDEEEDIEEYLDKIHAIVEAKGWSVEHQVGFSLFSFLNMNMYRDLDNHRDKVRNNPVVLALCGDNSMLKDKSIIDIKGFDHDRSQLPEHSFQVVDADSSQQDAILSAKKGYSFVLQGPPGTGKSQTITNIIAECLAAGKKVLFVSEKMAALEVVYKRLAEAQLSDYVLTLHSHKTSKKDIMDQLRKTLHLSRKKAKVGDEAAQKLHRLKDSRDQLNAYAAELHQRIDPLGLSVFEVNGRLANIQEAPDLSFDLFSVNRISLRELDNHISLLSNLRDSVESTTACIRANPWYGFDVEYITHEIRHNINNKIPKLASLGSSLSGLMLKLREAASLSAPLTVDGISRGLSLGELVRGAKVVPRSWLTAEDYETISDEIEKLRQTSAELIRLENEIEKNRRLLSDKDHSVQSISVLKMTPEEACEYAKRVSQEIEHNASFRNWKEMNNIEAIQSMLSEAELKAQRHRELEARVLEEYEPDLLKADSAGLYKRFLMNYRTVMRIFKGQYYRDRKTVVGTSLTNRKMTNADIMGVLKKLQIMTQLKKWFQDNRQVLDEFFPEYNLHEDTDYPVVKEELKRFTALFAVEACVRSIAENYNNLTVQSVALKEMFGTDYDGFASNWDTIDEKYKWFLRFKEKAANVRQGEDFVKAIALDENKAKITDELLTELGSQYKEFRLLYEWFLSLFDGQKQARLLLLNLEELSAKCESLLSNMPLLDEWMDYRLIRDECFSAGMGNYIDAIEESDVQKTDIVPAYLKRFYSLWLDTVLPGLPAVMKFRKREHERTIATFRDLDIQQFEIAKARIQQNLISSLPSIDSFSAGGSELSILRRELNKQKRIMPIRKLFRSIPNLLLEMKPCFMMSPLSVSLFLEADSYHFDTVIFDEASQVRTENAIGAISRGKQVIIAGDSKQLPPTNFFAVTTSDTEYDTEDDDDEAYYTDSAGFESLLDEAMLLPVQTLLWHYRSRHESLIAFSNSMIYDNSLITFPSSQLHTDNTGVEYYYVSDGVYDRGGRKGNQKEAGEVAKMVFDHFKQNPNRSLGVIAFGEVQQQAIENALYKMRLADKSYESFFREEREEAFFVKNLENVQGDERDTIIFSIGYAKASDGQMRMNFGPLSRIGGERRLNVAITRAKHNVKLVGSILPADIALERISAEGPKLLRSYIEYAQNRGAQLIACDEADDAYPGKFAFERAVEAFLLDQGYEVESNVGCSDYRIDLAVVHPGMEQEYAIGIECDGEMYNSARTARERDRLRESVLVSMGWNLYRVWSSDWVKKPTHVGNELIQAIERAIESRSKAAKPDILPAAEAVDDVPEADGDPQQNEYLVLANKEETDNHYGFGEYKETNPWTLQFPMGADRISESIVAIVENEFPIHFELLCQRLAFFYGRSKVTSVVRDEISDKLEELNRRVARKGDFLYPVPTPEIIVKLPNTRRVNMISVDELAMAAYIIAQKSVGSTPESLVVEVARAYGFSRAGVNIRRAVNKAIDYLLQSRSISIIDGKIIAGNERPWPMVDS
ncbi:MAG: DUF4011 domain-containing protein [Christensenellales bacterium]